MNKFKNLDHISEEELLKVARNAPDEDNELPEILRFLHAFRIDSGQNKITRNAIFELYRTWSREKTSRTLFFERFNRLFELKKGYYWLNLDPKIVLIYEHKNPEKKRNRAGPKAKEYFEKFLNAHNIKKGPLAIKDVVLYDLYDTWDNKREDKKNYFTFEAFLDFMKLYFKFKQDYKHHYFLLEPRVVDKMTEEQKLKCLSQKGQKYAKKKEDQKKSS